MVLLLGAYVRLQPKREMRVLSFAYFIIGDGAQSQANFAPERRVQTVIKTWQPDFY